MVAVLSRLMHAVGISALLLVAARAGEVRYQAEDAAYQGCAFSNKHANYYSTGYLDYGGQGSFAEWNIPVSSTGSYDLVVRYSVASESRPLDLFVDGSKLGTYAATKTDQWYKWKQETINVSLSKGTRRVRLVASTSRGGPNVDWIGVTFVQAHSEPASSPPSTGTLIFGSPTSIVIPSSSRLIIGEYIKSPNGSFNMGLISGDFVLRKETQVLWRAGTSSAEYVRCQKDGNIVVRNSSGGALWSSKTDGNNGAELVLSNQGQAAIVVGSNIIMLIPEAQNPASTPVASSFRVNGHPAAMVLQSTQRLDRNKFVFSPNGSHSVGIEGGDLVLKKGTQVIWRAGASGGYRLTMQRDGNLNLLDSNEKSKWTSGTHGNNGAEFVITDGGEAILVMGNTPLVIMPTPTSPTPAPPTPAPVAPTPRASSISRDGFAASIVLDSGSSFLPGMFVKSPNGRYKVGFSDGGDLVMFDGSAPLWKIGVVGARMYMQPDGNLVIRNGAGRAVWTSKTNGSGAYFIIDDGGQAAVVLEGAPLWLIGKPRGSYKGASSSDLSYPIRTMFYYPWYPETWTLGGSLAHHEPLRGYYTSDDPSVIADHIDQLNYAHVDLSVASWWGPGAQKDRSRIGALLDETKRVGSNMKWTVYYEDEFGQDPSVSVLKDDLDYLKEWYAWHPTWGHKNGKPIIFVYNEGGCEVANRWNQASNNEWYVVLKVFKGYEECLDKVDSWHQYGPATAVINLSKVSYCISPGFWLANRATPTLPRVDEATWRQNVRNMVASSAPWHVVTTFNEAGEGTMMESSVDWRSNTRYGFYLDALHEIY